MALTLGQGAQLVADASFNSRVRAVIVKVSVTIELEAQALQTSAVWAKRRGQANLILMSPDSQLPRFVALVASDPASSLNWFNPVNIASSTNANPSVITTAAVHSLTSGDVVEILNHLVNTSANGTWVATVLSTTTFSIPQPANGVGAATGTVQKMETDTNLFNAVNNSWNAMAGIATGE
jgi:uncharacterized protein (DUF2126 family)